MYIQRMTTHSTRVDIMVEKRIKHEKDLLLSETAVSKSRKILKILSHFSIYIYFLRIMGFLL